MLVGYARTSTMEQVAGFQAQLDALKGIGCDKVYQEQVSSVAHRKALSDALDFLREGDTLVVTKLDRLARSVLHLGEIVKKISEKGADLRILAMDIDTATPTGKLLLNMLGSVAEFERDMMLERQREGIAKAKAEGKYKGRTPTAMRLSDEIKRLSKEGMTRKAIAQRLEVSERSVYRALTA